MPGTGDVPADGGGPEPTPLAVRDIDWPLSTNRSVVVAGALGAVELQIRPSELSSPFGGGLSLEYHSRQPRPGADRRHQDCAVLSGDCYPDGGGGSAEADFLPFAVGQRHRGRCRRTDPPLPRHYLDQRPRVAR